MTATAKHHAGFVPAVSRSDLAHGKPLKTSVYRDGNVLYLNGIDGARFRAWFAPTFAAWLREHFASPEQVAVAFNVRASTAWTWWHGDNRASGDAVARLFMAFPDAVQWFLEAWGRA